MKLHTSPTSPFGLRIEIAARAKGVAMERIRPTSGVKTNEFLAMNPIGKIPVFVTDSGLTIPESETILRYLEDRFPSPSLLPVGAEERARVNEAIRIMDTYVMAPVIGTFPHLSEANRDHSVIAHEVSRWREGAAALAHFIKLPLPQAGAGISLADCVLPPSFHLSARIARILALSSDPLLEHEVLAAYYENVKRHPWIGSMLEELTAAQAEHDAQPARSH
jgi:glutathione S-transferase